MNISKHIEYVRDLRHSPPRRREMLAPHFALHADLYADGGPLEGFRQAALIQVSALSRYRSLEALAWVVAMMSPLAWSFVRERPGLVHACYEAALAWSYVEIADPEEWGYGEVVFAATRHIRHPTIKAVASLELYVESYSPKCGRHWSEWAFHDCRELIEVVAYGNPRRSGPWYEFRSAHIVKDTFDLNHVASDIEEFFWRYWDFGAAGPPKRR